MTGPGQDEEGASYSDVAAPLSNLEKARDILIKFSSTMPPGATLDDLHCAIPFHVLMGLVQELDGKANPKGKK
jgi:aconitase B